VRSSVQALFIWQTLWAAHRGNQDSQTAGAASGILLYFGSTCAEETPLARLCQVVGNSLIPFSHLPCLPERF